jgi:hypothetical protein
MKYLAEFLQKTGHTYQEVPTKPTEPREEEGQKPGHIYPDVPTGPTKPGSVGSVGGSPQVCPDFAPPWPPRPQELAAWPVAWREKWSRLANRLEDEGVPFPESERRAFHEIRASLRRGES